MEHLEAHELRAVCLHLGEGAHCAVCSIAPSAASGLGAEDDVVHNRSLLEFLHVDLFYFIKNES